MGLTGTEGIKAGLLGNENTLVETGGDNNKMFRFELDGDKKPLNKNLTMTQKEVFSRLSVTEFIVCHRFLNLKCFSGLISFILFIKLRHLSFNDI